MKLTKRKHTSTTNTFIGKHNKMKHSLDASSSKTILELVRLFQATPYSSKRCSDYSLLAIMQILNIIGHHLHEISHKPHNPNEV